jgi:hypothetical protein
MPQSDFRLIVEVVRVNRTPMAGGKGLPKDNRPQMPRIRQPQNLPHPVRTGLLARE